MERTAIIDLLASGGVPDAVLHGTGADDPESIARYDALRDPAGASLLASTLAAALRSCVADAILIGASVEDAVLAAFTARELGVGVVRSYVDEGLLFAPKLRSDMRLIVLTDVFRKPSALYSLWSLATERRGHVCAVGTLYELGPTVLPDPALPMTTLLRIDAPVTS